MASSISTGDFLNSAASMSHLRAVRSTVVLKSSSDGGGETAPLDEEGLGMGGRGFFSDGGVGFFSGGGAGGVGLNLSVTFSSAFPDRVLIPPLAGVACVPLAGIDSCCPDLLGTSQNLLFEFGADGGVCLSCCDCTLHDLFFLCVAHWQHTEKVKLGLV